MAGQSTPDYEFADTLELEDPLQYRALFEEARLRIVDLLSEWAATVLLALYPTDRPRLPDPGAEEEER